MDRDIMRVDPLNLAKNQYEWLKGFVIEALDAVKKLIEEDKFKEAKDKFYDLFEYGWTPYKLRDDAYGFDEAMDKLDDLKQRFGEERK